jgi:prevent-host-death family protein
MTRAARIKPISYFKANAAEIIQELGEVGEPMIITQNGEAKAVIQDIVSYEQTQETLALLKILALAERNIEEGRYRPAKEVFRDLRKELKAAKKNRA